MRSLASCQNPDAILAGVSEGTRRPAGPGGVTVSDVAAQAGVSRATAARALGHYGYVRPATRRLVERAAARLGYRPNNVARSMVTGRTKTIGFLSADMENPFFAQTMTGITDTCHLAGYEVMIANSQEDAERESKAVRLFRERRVDGLIVAPSQFVQRSHFISLIEDGIPVVFLDRAVRGVPADAVLIDNVAAGRSAVEWLIKAGHRRIGVLATELGGKPLHALATVARDPVHARTSAARAVGYLAALKQAGIRPQARLVASTHWSREGARRATLAMLETARPTAILTTDNVLTLGAYEALQGLPGMFPERISLLGFDDLEWTTIVRPSLSVVAQPAYDIGATAARRLLDRLSGDQSPPRNIFLETRLVIRDSTRPPGGGQAG
jgi:LacI family transcriptional regulator